MFYITTIITSLILWLWFFYIKSTREYNNEPIKFSIGAYLIGLILSFVPILNFLIPFIFTLCMIFDGDIKLKNGKQSIGEKIKNILNKEF